MKKLLIISIVLSCSFLNAQSIIEWNGGTPGKMDQWTEAKNWYPNEVPDETSNVIIKKKNNGHFSMPVIKSKVQVASISLHSDTYLTITDSGDLYIDGSEIFTFGIQNYGGECYNSGTIKLNQIDPSFHAISLFEIQGKGTILFDGKRIYGDLASAKF